MRASSAAFAAVVEREHRHREARRAEAALRRVRVDQRLLHRMQRAVRGRKPVDRQHAGAIELRQQHQAGIDRLVVQAIAVRPADHDGAGAAVAFGAAFLGAGQAGVEPQPVERGRGRRHARHGARLAVEQEADVGHDLAQNARGDYVAAAAWIVLLEPPCIERATSCAAAAREKRGLEGAGDGRLALAGLHGIADHDHGLPGTRQRLELRRRFRAGPDSRTSRAASAAKTTATRRASGRRPSRARSGRRGRGRSGSPRRSRSRCDRTAPAGRAVRAHRS